MTRPLIAVAIGFLLVIVGGCSGQPEVEEAPAVEELEIATSDWMIVAPEDLNEVQKAQQQRGVDAIKAMAGQLMGELTTALDEGGPDGAIEVCSMRAPEVAAAISNEYGLLLGRTSHKLRNQANLPPAWAEQIVSDRVVGPTFLAGPEGQLGGMAPIHLKAECGMCHGVPDEIDEGVMASINDFYPDDDATGFAEGDLRGWIWFEAPKS